MKITADDKIPFLKGALEQYAEVEYLPGGKISPANLKITDALITRTRTKCNVALLNGTPVKFIATATIGFDHIDTEYCGKNGIFWTNAPGCNSSSVAQYICSTLLYISIRSSIALRGKTLGIIGVGNVGSKVAKVAKALGMNLLLNDPPRERKEGPGSFVSLDRVLSEADFITMHVPLETEGKDKTFHLADENFFSRMNGKQYFINSSRGEVTHSSALKNALRNGKIAGAVLDVWENEPEIDRELLDMVLIGTPHIAGYSTDGKANGTSMSVNALAKYFKLDIHDWYPSSVPLPEKTEINLDSLENCSFDEKLFKAVSFTYDQLADDKRLRSSPETFEKQRADYPLRREFPVFSVKSQDKNILNALKNLGFKEIAS
ncbi:MAG: erythronate-4-phosphate dehydrogenase [Lentisphaerae bacterium GWF2_44_16]|nr:MAG: erythronate-4-phosphate dehydrogenase [Lentisphaerae bacterium GWF2_44_16]